MSFDELEFGLSAAQIDGRVMVRTDGDLSLYCYSRDTVYNASWDPITQVARGLILDRKARRIVATPFEKFFNLGESNQLAPSGDFEAEEKLDGSMITVFNYNDQWRTATKGSLDSDQARMAQKFIQADKLDRVGGTCIFELVGPSNKIVVKYPKDELRLIGHYNDMGFESITAREDVIAGLLGVLRPKLFKAKSLAQLVDHVDRLPADEEGFVIQWPNGLRLKVKGAEYLKLHRAINGLSPLSVWDIMQTGNAEAYRRELPEEFWADFDSIHEILSAKLKEILDDTAMLGAQWQDRSDKEVGLAIASGEIDRKKGQFLFAFRNGLIDTPRVITNMYREFRPTANRLDGYTASCSLNRAVEEMSG
jgi:RNA ligase